MFRFTKINLHKAFAKFFSCRWSIRDCRLMSNVFVCSLTSFASGLSSFVMSLYTTALAILLLDSVNIFASTILYTYVSKLFKICCHVHEQQFISKVCHFVAAFLSLSSFPSSLCAPSSLIGKECVKRRTIHKKAFISPSLCSTVVLRASHIVQTFPTETFLRATL